MDHEQNYLKYLNFPWKVSLNEKTYRTIVYKASGGNHEMKCNEISFSGTSCSLETCRDFSAVEEECFVGGILVDKWMRHIPLSLSNFSASHFSICKINHKKIIQDFSMSLRNTKYRKIKEIFSHVFCEYFEIAGSQNTTPLWGEVFYLWV